MPEVTANGLRFFVVDEGGGRASATRSEAQPRGAPAARRAGAPVVLLHGFPDTTEMWRPQIAALVGAGYRAIAPDLRGRGRSEKPPRVEDYALSLITQDVAALLDALGVERAHVVGHDWGAAVAWRFAATLPQRVDHLVAISVGYPGAGGAPTLEELQKAWYQLFFQFEGVAEEVMQRDDWSLFRRLFQGGGDIERYIADLSQPGALTAGLNWYRANLPPRRFMRAPRPLPPIQAPTMGIYSTGDLYLTEDRMVHSAEHVAGPWRYERFEGASHWVPIQEPERLNQLLLEFLGT
jgi:pimeloyl-ACP methyl ester carboxylesterase